MPKFFDKEFKDKQKFRLIYDQGGLVSTAIDSFPLIALTNGYTLEGDDENLVAYVQEQLDKLDIESLLFHCIKESLVLKDGIAELVWTLDGKEIAYFTKPHSEKFEIGMQFGKPQSYSYREDQFSKAITLEPKEVFHLDLDMWLMRRAYDDIIRDAKISEASANAILRHGFPRWHVKVGQPGEMVSEEAINAVSGYFDGLKPNSEMTTSHDVEVLNIDNAGLANLDVYLQWSIVRISAALGVPEEVLGLGRGSTEATANIRKEIFYDTIGTIQKKADRQVNLQIIDRITGKPGAVTFYLNDINPEDEQKVANFCKTLKDADSLSPIISNTWIRKRLNIEDPDAEEMEEEAEAEEEEKLNNPQPPPTPGVTPPQLAPFAKATQDQAQAPKGDDEKPSAETESK
jgi:hypothetical protein